VDSFLPHDELYHEIFGSILDRTEMTPYLLKRCDGYQSALRQASGMMRNRGFDTGGSAEPGDGEMARAQVYVRQVRKYYLGWLFPFVKNQLEQLAHTAGEGGALYVSCVSSIEKLEAVLADPAFTALVDEDPRHLFLMASSRKYPDLFCGRGGVHHIPPEWQRMSCSILKMCHLVKAIEEDSQDIHDYAQLGIFFESQGKSLKDLFRFDWNNPDPVPDDDPARRGFVKLSAFFRRMSDSMSFDRAKNCYIFNSGDGVEVDIVDVKARLKSPESMFAKLGKNVEGEVHDIRDILAITFLLKSRDDTLTLFHALQKRGVILQENTVSHSITQTLFSCPDDMKEAVRLLMVSIARSGGIQASPDDGELKANALQFFSALNINARENHHTSGGHRKFQCKINFSLPIHRRADSHCILVPGTAEYDMRSTFPVTTRQYTLPVELRISDEESWNASEQKGDAHHDAYKCRQLAALMNRLFSQDFSLPQDRFNELRADQKRLFS
jgi:uncharacterized protein (TIGR04552 family)